jgi:hypothetical protein
VTLEDVALDSDTLSRARELAATYHWSVEETLRKSILFLELLAIGDQGGKGGVKLGLLRDNYWQPIGIRS